MRTLWVLILFGSLIIHHCFTTVAGEDVPSEKAQTHPSFSECKTYVDAALKGDIPAEPPAAAEPSSSVPAPDSGAASQPPPADNDDDDDDEDDEASKKVTNEPKADAADQDDDDDSHEEAAVAQEADDDSSEETEAVETKDHDDDDDSSEEAGLKAHGEVHDDDDEDESGEEGKGEGEAAAETKEDDSSSEEDVAPVQPEPVTTATKKTKAEAAKPESEESDEDDDEPPAAAPQTQSEKSKRDAPVPSPVADDSDESDESASQEKEAQETKTTKGGAVKAPAQEADDDDSSEEEEVEPVKPSKKAKKENKPEKAPKATKSPPPEDDDSSEEDEVEPVKVSKKSARSEQKSEKPSKAAKSPPPPAEDDDDDSSEEIEEVKPKKKTAKETKKVEPADDDDDDDSSEEVEVAKVKKKTAKSKVTKQAAAEEDDDDSDEDDDDDSSEEDDEDSYIPRSRSHLNKILGLDDNDDKKQKHGLLDKVTLQTLKELKSTYEYSIKPLETMYKYRDLSNRHFGDPEIFSKPMIVFMGPWSGGKSTIINWLLGIQGDEHALRTGADPSPAQFNIMIHGDEDEVLDGTQLAADWTFSGLQKFGQAFLDRLRGRKLPNRLLEKVNLVEIPGILEIRKQVERSFPFNDACQWFIDRADVLFLVYDPAKLDIGPETEAILDQLKGRENQVRIVLNKADSVKPDELLRVQATLIWNISPLMASAEPPVLYVASLWDRPFQPDSPVSLLTSHENLFLKDISDATVKRVETRIAAARRFAVRVRNHAKMCDCYLTTYNNHRSFFSNKKRVSDDIIDHPQNYHIYEGLSTLTNISRYDLPDPDTYKDFFRLNPMWEFPTLASTCTYFRGCPINKLDIAIAYDLPELLGRYRRQRESILTSPVGSLPTIQFKEIPKPPEDKPAAPKNKWRKDPEEPAQAPAKPVKVEEPVKAKKKWQKNEEPEQPAPPIEEAKPKSKSKEKEAAKPKVQEEAKPAEPLNKGKLRWWKPYTEPEKPAGAQEEEPVNIGKKRWWKPYVEPEKPDTPVEEEPINIGKKRWWKPYTPPEKTPEEEAPKPKNKWRKS